MLGLGRPRRSTSSSRQFGNEGLWRRTAAKSNRCGVSHRARDRGKGRMSQGQATQQQVRRDFVCHSASGGQPCSAPRCLRYPHFIRAAGALGYVQKHVFLFLDSRNGFEMWLRVDQMRCTIALLCTVQQQISESRHETGGQRLGGGRSLVLDRLDIAGCLARWERVGPLLYLTGGTDRPSKSQACPG